MSRVSLKRSFSVHSSDTEGPITPVKRQRLDIGSPCPSEDTPSVCHIRTKPSRKTREDSQSFDLVSALRCCNYGLDQSILEDFKGLTRGKHLVQAVQSLLHIVKVNVKADTNQRIIETELYLRWLAELDFAVDGVENLLNAKIPQTRRRVKGLGRVTFAILYHIIDGFISDVDSHHDGWLSRGAEEHPIYPVTMTLAEEAKDSSTDQRAERVLRAAEASLRRYDDVMEVAVRRLKAECGKSYKVGRMVGQKERALARACCLLCEQTGFGGEKSATGDSLLRSTRRFMRQWKAEYGITDADDCDTEDEI